MSRRIIPKAAGVRVVSKKVALSLSKAGIKLRRPPDILPVYIDTTRFASAYENFDLRRKHPQFDFLMLCVGRLQPEKNFTLAIKILGKILLKRPHAGLFIVGDGPEKSRLEALASRLGLKDKVVFAPYDKNLFRYYKSADVFILPSLYEGYGLVLVEAALAGCPIVTNDVGVAREIIPEEFSKFICQVGVASCFVRKIMELADDHEQKEKYTEALLASAKGHTDFDKQAYMKEYMSILGETAKYL